MSCLSIPWSTVYPKKYANGFCFAVLCCGYTLIDFPISIRLPLLALWQSNDCPSASKATLMNMDKYFMWIHYERLHNHSKAKHNKTVCIFLGIYCTLRHVSNRMPRYIQFCRASSTTINVLSIGIDFVTADSHAMMQKYTWHVTHGTINHKCAHYYEYIAFETAKKFFKQKIFSNMGAE